MQLSDAASLQLPGWAMQLPHSFLAGRCSFPAASCLADAAAPQFPGWAMQLPGSSAGQYHVGKLAGDSSYVTACT